MTLDQQSQPGLANRKHCCRNILSQHTLLGYANEETFADSGNIQCQCFFSVSQMFPRLRLHAINVEDTKTSS